MSDAAPSRQLNLCKPYLGLIAGGIKTVEVRVGYSEIRRIKQVASCPLSLAMPTVVTRVKANH
ncbi:MAG: hypothetical protein ACRDRW_15235 [Pseudonocardiaceae bacterium]